MKPTIHFYLIALFLIAISIILVIIFDCGIPCKLPQVQIDQINNVLLSLSTSAICSILFYYVLVYYPEKQRAKIIQSTIDYNLQNIVNQMNWLFAFIARENGFLNDVQYNDMYSDIPTDKLQNLTISSDNNPVYRSFEQYFLFGNTVKEAPHWATIHKVDFYEHYHIIQQNVSTILSLPFTSLLDTNLIKILNDLRTNYFLDSIKNANIPNQGNEQQEFFRVVDYYKIYLDLIKLVKPTIVYKLV